MKRPNRGTLTLILAGLGIATAACSDGPMENLTFSARMLAGGAVGAAGPALTSGDGRVTIDRVRMVIRDIKLEREGTEGEVEAANGPFLLDLAGPALDGGITQLFAADVPAGTYDELRFVIHRLEDGQAIGDPDIDALRVSILLDLTVDGEAGVRFASEVNDQQRLGGTFVVDEGGSSDNITIQIDPSGWFTGSGGEFLDPRSSGNRQQIEENLRASIDAFDDDDMDGHDDDGPGHT